ncbi:plasmid recombination protein [Paracoccus denitrificans]|uniref:plasmid recombination protein n=1 Tax=Paracoccus denitrificans TaxID=266 RepID=UPI001E5254ED|nr:plasmid recombination protein [Paracoccus denitrificans]UFS65734.1 plasmid recombination protein [Paracoccus denitrificans]
MVALIEQRIAEQNKLLRRLRKEQPERKDAARTIRSDTHVLIASVFSFPDPVEDMNEADYLRWRKDVIAFARDDAARNGAEVLSIVEHLDEAHPHVHVLAVPLCADGNMRMDAKRCHESFRAQTEHAQKGWSGSPSRSYKQAMRGWQDRYHAEVGSKHGQARTGPKRDRLDRRAWNARKARLQALKEEVIAVERAAEARRLADEEERRRDAVMQDTVARRLQEAEAVHAIATGGLIAAIRQADPDPVLLERLETPGQMGSWTNHDADRNREMSGALAPVLSDGLEALRQLPAGPGLLGGLSGFLRGLAGWVNRLADASPRWLKWPETVAYVAQGTKQAFGMTYTASTVAEVVEASPAWRSFTGKARARLDQARAVQALTHPRDSRPDASSQRGI